MPVAFHAVGRALVHLAMIVGVHVVVLIPAQTADIDGIHLLVGETTTVAAQDNACKTVQAAKLSLLAAIQNVRVAKLVGMMKIAVIAHKIVA